MKPIVEDGETLDWYAADPKDFFDGTGSYMFEVKASYRLVLDLIYSSPRCELPDKSQDIAKRLGMTTNAWNKARAQLVQDGKLQARDGVLTNRRASAYWSENMPKISENRAKIAEKRSKKQPEKQAKKPADLFPTEVKQGVTPPGKGQKAPYAGARESESEIERESDKARPGASPGEIITLVSAIAEALDQTRGMYWEGDLRTILNGNPELTGEDMIEAAKAHKANRADPVRKMAALVNLAKRKAEDRTWKTRTAPPPPPASAPVHSDTAWGKALEQLLLAGAWVASEYGPPPTRPGHHVPPALYDQWRALWDAQGQHPLSEFDASGNRSPYPASNPSPVSRSLWEHQA